MALTYGEGIYGNADGVTTPLDHRLAQVTEFAKTTTPNLIRSGLLYNGTSTIVTGTSGMSYDVSAFSAVSSRGVSQGVVKFANTGTVNVATGAAPGSNSRYDVVYAWPRDYAIDGTDSVPVLGVVQGTAAASPTVPSLSAFPGAIELARILVPAGVVATNSGTTITQTAPFTSTDGGTVPFRTMTEMDTWTTALQGQRAVDLSRGVACEYFAAYNASSNPGGARVAGWYPVGARRADRKSSNTAFANASTGDGTDVLLDTSLDGSTIAEFLTYNSATGVYTVVRDGLFRFTCDIVWEGNATGYRLLRLWWKATSGGSTWYEQKISTITPGVAVTMTQNAVLDLPLAAGNVLKLTGRQNSGGSLNMLGATTVPAAASSNYSSMATVELIGPVRA